MNMLAAALAFAALLASPALAQFRGWQGPFPAYGYPQWALAEQARPYLYNYASRRSATGFDVYDTRGLYMGSDPDPHVRSMLARDRLSTY